VIRLDDGRDYRRDEARVPAFAPQHVYRESPLPGMIRSVVDAGIRCLLVAAYRGARIWWFLARPTHIGAVAAIWHGGELLLVRSSYRRGWTLPGGGVGASEAPREAARREIGEEVGIALEGASLNPAIAVEDDWESRRETVHVFETRLLRRPAIRVDRREIVEARWMTPAAARQERLPPHVRRYLDWHDSAARGATAAL
jgi:ADP-ribose pyrophosphatase YjhB (NUDIX family)